MHSIVTTALAVALAVTAGCGIAPKRPNTLIEDLRGYNEGVRWRDHGKAAIRIPPAQREAFIEERREFEDDLRVSDYEILNIRYRDGRRRARVDVRFTWYLDSQGIVHDTTTRQDWELFDKVWLLLGEHRVDGDPMPGVADQEQEPEETAGFSGARSGDARVVVE